MHINVEPKKPLPLAPAPTLLGKYWYLIPIILLAMCLFYLLFSGNLNISFKNITQGINREFFIFLAIGIAAQLVDGTLGMGYGATSNSLLLTMGLSPVIGSTSVHMAEMFTTGASAIAHHRFGNINKKLFKYLLIPGTLGSISGAVLLSYISQFAYLIEYIKPIVTIYMAILGFVIIKKALKKTIVKAKTKKLGALATFGGFMDAFGGGGWGPIVTSTLLGRGRDPKYTIGSVNAAEFAVAFSSGITFMLFADFNSWQVASGLIIGGVLAAPVAAKLLGKIPRKPAMVAVGCLVIFLSCRTLLKIFL